VSCRSLLLWTIEQCGDHDEALALCEELDRSRTSLARQAAGITRGRIFLARGDLAAAAGAIEGWAARLSGDVDTSEHFWTAVLRGQLAIAREQVDAGVLDALEELRGRAAASGHLWPAMNATSWLCLSIAARLALLFAGRLPDRELGRISRMAGAVVGRGWTPLRSAGHRTLAILELARGRPDRAAPHVELALADARATGGPWHEWLTLHLQRQLGAAGDDQLEEMARRHRFGTGLAPERLVW
jgi:hypothetical protein